MGRVLVGALCAVSLFMFYYTGYDQWDNWAGNAAGFFALGTAWIPTTEAGRLDTTGIFHFSFAASLFIVFSLLLFTMHDKSKGMTTRKRYRNYIYIGCGAAMIISLLR